MTYDDIIKRTGNLNAPVNVTRNQKNLQFVKKIRHMVDMGCVVLQLSLLVLLVIFAIKQHFS